MSLRNKNSMPTKVAPKNSKKNTVSGTPTKVTLPKRRSGASRQGSIEEDAIRFKIVWGLMGGIFVAIFCRLAYIQLINKDYYQDKNGDVLEIGDCKRARRIIEGTQEGRNIIHLLKQKELL